MQPTPFESYACSLGTVVGHDAGSYIISTIDGRVIGVAANGQPSPENVEADIASPPAPLAPVPSEVPLWAFRQVLIEDGQLEQIEAFVTGLPDAMLRKKLQNFLLTGNFIMRNSPSLSALASEINKTPAEIDDIFRRAAAVVL